MNGLRLGLAALLLSVAAPALAAPAATDTPTATSGGTSLTIPQGWDSATGPKAITLKPAETDTRLVIVDVGPAKDASAAAEAAWALAGGNKAPLKLVTPRGARQGWEERVGITYDTPPNARRIVEAYAYRHGEAWTVALLDGSEPTVEKRDAALALVLASLRPAGYTRESFAGRTAHPLDAARIETLKAFVAKGMEQLGVPGVGLAFIDHGRIVYEGGLGVRQAGRPEPVTAQTRFMIASNTKSMATMLLAKAVDDGKLRWDQPVVEVYPAFRLGDDATTKATQIRHLVCACTGLPRKDFEWVFNTTAATPASDTFRQLAATQPTSKFGEAFQYNNLMASAAGFIAGHSFHPDMELGAAFDRSVAELIWRPVGMNNSTFDFDAALAADHADPHAYDINDKLQLADQGLNRAIAPFRPAGGAWSSSGDMIRYVALELAGGIAMDGKRVISTENLFARRARGVPTGEDMWYGMGLQENSRWGVKVIHHGGDVVGYHSDMMWLPDAQVGAVILTNGEWGYALRGPLMRRLLEVLYDGKPEAEGDLATSIARLRALNADFRARLTLPADAGAVTALAPAYRNADLGRLRVLRDGGKVRFQGAAFTAEVATRRNTDQTISFVTIEPGLQDVAFVVGTKDGKRTLTTRDAQHEYVFVEE